MWDHTRFVVAVGMLCWVVTSMAAAPSQLVLHNQTHEPVSLQIMGDDLASTQPHADRMIEWSTLRATCGFVQVCTIRVKVHSHTAAAWLLPDMSLDLGTGVWSANVSHRGFRVVAMGPAELVVQHGPAR